MGSMAPSSAVRRPDLGMAVTGYFDDGPAGGFIGRKLMPVIKTKRMSATFPVIGKKAFLNAPDLKRAPRSGFHRDEWVGGRGKFDCESYGHEEAVDDDERDLIDEETPGLADFIAVKRANLIIERVREKRYADMLFSTTYLTAHDVTNEWDDASAATPIDDVEAAKLAVRKACGKLPDTLTITYSTYSNLKQVDQIVNRLKYTFPGIDLNRLTSAQLAAVFDVGRVVIAGAVYDSAGEGQAATVADMWSNEYALLSVTAPEGLRDFSEPCLGWTFVCTVDSDDDPFVTWYRDEPKMSDMYRVRHKTDECLCQSVDSSGTAVEEVYKDACYLLGNITTI